MSTQTCIELESTQLAAICTSIVFSGIYGNISETRDDEFIIKTAEVVKKIIEESKK